MEKSQSINMHTSLSRHLFRLDEVASALRYSVVERRIEEGIYWTLELLDSSEYKLLFDTLLEAWLSLIGCARLGFLFEFSKLLDTIIAGAAESELTKSFLVLSYNLLRVPKDCRDGSVLAIAILGLEDFRSAGIHLSLDQQMARLSISGGSSTAELKSILYAGANPITAVRTWLQTHAFDSNLPVVSPTRRTAQAACRSLKNYKHICGWKYIWVCFEILILIMDDKYYVEAIRDSVNQPIGAGMNEQLDCWIKLTGRRKRRCFTIPKWCLKWCTERGRSPYTPMNLHEIREPWKAMGRSIYWSQKAAEFGCVINGNEILPIESSDEAWEGFTEFAFPDDIPDEWSLEDQMKSHGEGAIAAGDSPSLPNWFRAWFPENSIAVVGARSKINKILENEPIYPNVIWFDEWLSSHLAATLA